MTDHNVKKTVVLRTNVNCKFQLSTFFSPCWEEVVIIIISIIFFFFLCMEYAEKQLVFNLEVAN